MITKAIALTLLMCTASSYAMHTDSQRQPWIRQASMIYISTTTQKHMCDVSINDGSTVADVKMSIQDQGGIQPSIQSLYPRFTSWRTLWLLDTTGTKLADDSIKIKTIMNEHNTDRFLVALSFKSQNQQ